MPQSLSQFQREHSFKTDEIAVWLQQDINNPKLTLFHCNYCKNPLIEFSEKVVTIFPGKGEGKFPIVVICKQKWCGRKYHFYSITRKEIA